MKALYPTISYTLFIAISVAALSVLLISVRSFAEETQTTYARGQLECAAEIVRNDVMSLYATESSGAITTGLPEYIVGRRYSIEADNRSITLSLEMSGRIIVAVRTLDANISMVGRGHASAFLEYQKEEGILAIR